MAKLIKLLAAGLFLTVATSAHAGSQSCKSGFYFDTQSLACVKQVRLQIGSQDVRAAAGPQWGPVNAANCAAASREMDRSMALCRSYDARKGAYDANLGRVVDGKLVEECGKCCRQLREGMRRWAACFAKGLAPQPDYTTARRSAAALNCPETY